MRTYNSLYLTYGKAVQYFYYNQLILRFANNMSIFHLCQDYSIYAVMVKVI